MFPSKLHALPDELYAIPEIAHVFQVVLLLLLLFHFFFFCSQRTALQTNVIFGMNTCKVFRELIPCYKWTDFGEDIKDILGWNSLCSDCTLSWTINLSHKYYEKHSIIPWNHSWNRTVLFSTTCPFQWMQVITITIQK